MKKKLPQLTSFLLVIILIGCVSLLFFSDRGIISLWELKKEKSYYLPKNIKKPSEIIDILTDCTNNSKEDILSCF